MVLQKDEILPFAFATLAIGWGILGTVFHTPQTHPFGIYGYYLSALGILLGSAVIVAEVND